MSSFTATANPTSIDARHPLCRGGYAAIVFSGQRDVLGELVGEPTAHTQWKFVLDDPALAAADDFARTSGATLPAWPENDIRPIDGLCFVFTSAEHPAIEKLVAGGAQEEEHFVVTAGLHFLQQDAVLQQRLTAFLREFPRRGKIAILGYGHQGRRVVEFLRQQHAIEPERILIHDSNAGSRARAEEDGLGVVVRESDVLSQSAAIVASPLRAHEPITALATQARTMGLPVFDNAQPCSDLRHWTKQTHKVWMDEAAGRALTITAGTRLTCDDALLRPLLAASIVREDLRVLNGVRLPHLQSGQVHAFVAGTGIDLAQRWPGDGFANDTCLSLRRAFVSLRNRADSGFFAARELCLELWPTATQAIFPSEHVIDLGATAFERLLKGHLDGREIVSTMQCPAQRITLGVVAARYASQQPIVEIGSAFGGSALLMAAATSQNRPLITSIDPDTPTRDIMRFAFEREGHGERLQQIVKTSDDAIADLAHLRGKCGLVFIDGLHTAEAVLRDFHNYTPLVTVGGGLAFHDVCPAIHAVMQVVVENVLKEDRFAPKCLVDGLLVLERIG